MAKAPSGREAGRCSGRRRSRRRLSRHPPAWRRRRSPCQSPGGGLVGAGIEEHGVVQAWRAAELVLEPATLGFQGHCPVGLMRTILLSQVTTCRKPRSNATTGSSVPGQLCQRRSCGRVMGSPAPGHLAWAETGRVPGLGLAGGLVPPCPRSALLHTAAARLSAPALARRHRLECAAFSRLDPARRCDRPGPSSGGRRAGGPPGSGRHGKGN